MMRTNLYLMISVVTLALSGAASPAAELLTNGRFEQGTAGWHLSQQEQARAVFRVRPGDSPSGGQAAEIRVTTKGPPHRLQLTHPFANRLLEPGAAYVLRFDAKATQPTGFQVLLMNAQRPWQNLGLRRSVAVETTWKSFQFPFRARRSEQPTGKVNFFLGQAEGTVFLDGVTIEPYTVEVAEPDGPTLRAANWRLQFYRTGAIGRLLHVPSGQVLIEPGVDRSAYEVTLRTGDASQVLDSRQARRIQVDELEPAPGAGRGYRFVAHHDQAVVTMEYRVDPPTGLLACRGRVENLGDAAIVRWRFPLVHVPETLGAASDDDLLLYPAFDGMVIDDPRAAFRSYGGTLSSTYPGPLSCQVMAFCDPRAGLYLASHDADGHAKQFHVEPGFQFRLDITHLAPFVPGRDLIPSYPIMLGVFAGDAARRGTTWYDAADIYRRWAQQQRWAERKVQTRPDTPDWLRQGALVTFYNPRQLTPAGDLSRLEQLVSDYSHRFGLPLLANNRGFERYGTWCGQEYLPVMPDEATFRGAAELTGRLGGRSMVMLSGYRWTIERQTPEGETYSSQQRFDREVARWAVHDASGKPVVKTSDRPGDYHGHKWSRMCRATEFARQTIVDQAAYFVRNGYSVIHFDQECSGGYAASVCWADGHGHPPGDGRWIHLAMADLYQRLCDTCRPLDPDFMLSMEEPNELYLPWLNACQSRPYGITPEWPVIRPGTRSVPLFLYLYHENLVQWAAFYPWKSAGRPWYSLAKGFSAGLMPGLVPPQNLPKTADGQTEQLLELLRNCAAGYRTFAHDYLLFGRMERPLAIRVPQRRLTRGAPDSKLRPVVVPAVSHQVWRLADGRVGVVLVNPERQPHKLDVDLTPLHEDERPPIVQEHSTQRGKRVHRSARLRLEIAPLDMVLLESGSTVPASSSSDE